MGLLLSPNDTHELKWTEHVNVKTETEELLEDTGYMFCDIAHGFDMKLFVCISMNRQKIQRDKCNYFKPNIRYYKRETSCESKTREKKGFKGW